MFPGADALLHWSFDDPAAAEGPEQTKLFHRVRDEIQEQMRAFLSDHPHGEKGR
jgi:arsenate reductase